MVNGDSGTSHTGAMHSYYKCKGRKHKHCDLPTFKKEELEDCIVFAIVSALKDSGFVKPLAKAIYDQQAQESPKVRNIRDKLSEIGMKKTNLMNAIMMGVVTGTTKSTLLELESDEKKFQSTLTELQIQHRKFSRAEIEASLEILTDKPFKTDMEKKALFTKFITRIDLYKDGRMNIYTDIFGIKGEIQAIDKSKSEVQLEKRLARHKWGCYEINSSETASTRSKKK